MFAAEAVEAAATAAAAVVAIGEKGDPGGKLPWQETLAIYLGIPVAVAAIIVMIWLSSKGVKP